MAGPPPIYAQLKSRNPRRFVNVDAMKAFAERRQDLVADRAGQPGNVVDGLVGTDQFDQVAGLQAAGRQTRNVEDDAVHRDAPDKGKLHAVTPGRGSGATRPAIGVTERDG